MCYLLFRCFPELNKKEKIREAAHNSLMNQRVRGRKEKKENRNFKRGVPKQEMYPRHGDCEMERWRDSRGGNTWRERESRNKGHLREERKKIDYTRLRWMQSPTYYRAVCVTIKTDNLSEWVVRTLIRRSISSTSLIWFRLPWITSIWARLVTSGVTAFW